jgi:hypothetical protein
MESALLFWAFSAFVAETAVQREQNLGSGLWDPTFSLIAADVTI